MENQGEIWKDIPGWEGIYLVSNIGNIRSLDRRIASGKPKGRLIKGRVRKLLVMKDKYVSINLLDKASGKLTRNSVHVFVAQAFIPNPENKPEVNHKDGNKHNNLVDNLEWNTSGENNKHAYDTGLKKPRKFTEAQKANMREKAKHYTQLKNWQKNNKDKMIERALSASLGQVKKVNQLDLNGNFIKEWFSMADASRETKTSHCGILRCAKGRQESSNGFKWEYVKI